MGELILLVRIAKQPLRNSLISIIEVLLQQVELTLARSVVETVGKGTKCLKVCDLSFAIN